MRRLTVAALAVFAIAAPAQAAPVRGLHIGGQAMQSEFWQWAADASNHVQLPNARIVLTHGTGSYAGTRPQSQIDLPRVGDTDARNGRVWTTEEQIHGGFLHELGHAYDDWMMTPARRNEFKEAIGVPACRWRGECYVSSTPCEWWGRCFYRLTPEEMFAEEYAACAMGLTQIEYQHGDHATYGWLPPRGTDETLLCALMR